MAKHKEHDGSYWRYNKQSCRCVNCIKAKTEWTKNRKKYWAEHPDEIPSEKHGTTTGYSYYGCKCFRCKEASRMYHKWRRTGSAY